MKRTIAIGVVALAIIGAGVYFWTKMGSNSSPTVNTPNASSPASDTQSVAATIVFSDSGFSPSKTTVKSGDKVAIKNDSSTDVQFDSDPHPIHTDDEDLNVNEIAPGEVKTFTVSKKGTFGFHNHLNPGQKGTIVVE